MAGSRTGTLKAVEGAKVLDLMAATSSMDNEILIGNDGTTAKPDTLLKDLPTDKVVSCTGGCGIDPNYVWTGDASKVELVWGEWSMGH